MSLASVALDTAGGQVVEGGDFALHSCKPGSHILTVVGQEFEKTTMEVTVPPIGDLDVGVIVVRRGRIIRGRVVSGRDGASITGATVTAAKMLTSVDASDANPFSYDRKVVISGDDGLFEIAGAANETLLLEATRGASERSTAVSVSPDVSDKEVELVIDPTGSIMGRVYDDLKRETPTLVTAVSRGNSRSRFSASATPDGQYRIDGVPAGDYRVTATAAMTKGRTVSVVTRGRVKAGKFEPPSSHAGWHARGHVRDGGARHGGRPSPRLGSGHRRPHGGRARSRGDGAQPGHPRRSGRRQRERPSPSIV